MARSSDAVAGHHVIVLGFSFISHLSVAHRFMTFSSRRQRKVVCFKQTLFFLHRSNYFKQHEIYIYIKVSIYQYNFDNVSLTNRLIINLLK